MNNILKYVGIFIFATFATLANANEWTDVQWKSGQILGISARAGVIPPLSQLGLLSQIDHVGVVLIDESGPWLYEYNISNGIQKTAISEVWDRSRDIKKNVHFIVGSFAEILTDEEIVEISKRFEDWKTKKNLDQPKNCIDAVLKVFEGIRNVSVIYRPMPVIIQRAFNGKLKQFINKVYPGEKLYPVISSLFEDSNESKNEETSQLIRSSGNINQLYWESPTSFIAEWIENGDLSRFIRLLGGPFENKDKKTVSTEAEAIKTHLLNEEQMIKSEALCKELFL